MLPADINTPALVAAIAHVESHNNPEAIGDNGKALGPYQMHEGAWQDAWRHLEKRGLEPSTYIGKNWHWIHGKDGEAYARNACQAYLEAISDYLDRHNVPVTVESLAGAYNVGYVAAVHDPSTLARARRYAHRVSLVYQSTIAGD